MNILVGIDGSPHADRALSWALREAALRSARVTVLNAFKVRELAGPLNKDVSLEAERGEAQAAVEQALERVAGEGHPSGVEVDTAAVTGRGAADAILRHRDDVDLIVVGSRGLGGFPGLLLGSVSHQVVAHADVPVAVIPQHDGEVGDGADSTRSIVVGIDGSAASVQALQWAEAEAALRGVPLTAIYVYRSLRSGAPFDALNSIPEGELSKLEDQGIETALRKLDALIDEARGAGGVEIQRRVQAGSPAKVLINDAADETTMLVVGSRGHGGFRGLLLGSVSQQCIHHARGPVVVTPVHH
jgi:nucleotide-binding universal stress UspA family protein